MRNAPSPTVPPDADVRILPSAEPEESPEESEDKIGLSELLELAAALRTAVGPARPLAPADVSVPGAGEQATLASAELAARASDAATALQAADGRLSDALDPAADSEALRAALLAAAAFGVPGAVPLSAVGDSPAIRADLRAQAATAQSQVRRRLAAAPPAAAANLAGELRDNALERLHAVFGRTSRRCRC